MRKDDLEMLSVTGYIDSRRDTEKQQVPNDLAEIDVKTKCVRDGDGTKLTESRKG